MFKLLFFFSLFFICTCTSRTNIGKRQEKIPIQWQYLTFEFNDTVIYLDQVRDTLEVAAGKEGIQKYQINKVEKDILFEQANELIGFKKQPTQFCTDYVGNLKVLIRYNSQLTKEISFSSICDWRRINGNTNRIDRLLKKVILNNNMGN